MKTSKIAALVAVLFSGLGGVSAQSLEITEGGGKP